MQKNPQYKYKAPFAILSSYFGQYQQEYNTLENNYKFLSLLFYANCLISAFAFLILITVFAIVNYLNIFSTAISVIIFLLLAFNCYLSERTLSEVKGGFKFPSPQDLLTPDYVLDEYCSEIFGINKYLPLILFHTSTSIVIRPTDELINNTQIKDKKIDLKQTKFYIMINSCLKFNLNYLKIQYSNFYETFEKIIFQQTNIYEHSYKIALFPAYEVVDQFQHFCINYFYEHVDNYSNLNDNQKKSDISLCTRYFKEDSISKNIITLNNIPYNKQKLYNTYDKLTYKQRNFFDSISKPNNTTINLELKFCTINLSSLLIYKFAQNYSLSTYQLYIPTFNLYTNNNSKSDDDLRINFGIYNKYNHQ